MWGFMGYQRDIGKGTVLYIGGGGYIKQERLHEHLRSLGIILHKASSISIAKQRMSKNRYDILLIQFESIRDIIFDFCEIIRRKYHRIVVFVLMSKVMPLIESKLFECGVDDIVVGKQAFPVTLKSRIKRRLVGRLSTDNADKVMLKGGAIVDLKRREVCLDGLYHRLRGVSYQLLQYFLKNPNRVISREELLNSNIWDNSVCSSNKIEQGKAIDMAVARLRKRIESNTSKPQIIIAVHGIGWILAKNAVL